MHRCRAGILAVVGAFALAGAARSQPASPTVTASPISATELVAFSGQVATMTDPDTAVGPSNFAASIDWGDGTTSVGTVAGSAGSFTISGGHTYPDEGSFSTSIVVNDTLDASIGSGGGTATVAEHDALSGTGVPFTAFVGSSFSGTVANFTDTDTSNVPSDFVATIDWGDGTTTAGTVSGGSGSFAVSGVHTYAAAGSPTTLTVTLTDDAPGTAFGQVSFGSSVFPAGLSVTGTPVTATEGAAFSGTVGGFTDSDTGQPKSNFTSFIDWGDGTTTAGTVSGSAGAFSVSGSHTYDDEGSFGGILSVADAHDVITKTALIAVTAQEGDVLTGTPASFTAVVGVGFVGQTVATFTDSDTSNVPSDFVATIDWGDATTTAGTVTGSAGSFAVVGGHTYADKGAKTLTVFLDDDAPGTAVGEATSSAAVIGPGLTVSGSTPSATEGVPFSGTVGSFTDSDTAQPNSNFSATIDWGDGTTTAGTVTGSAGIFSMTGSHTFDDEGTFSGGRVFVHDIADNLTMSATVTFTVAEHDALVGTGVDFAASPGLPFTGTVAHFTDTDTTNVPGDFVATIDWGDGATTAGTVTGGAGAFSVSGTHTYAAVRPFTVTTTLSDDAPGTATATAQSTASVVANAVPTLGGVGLALLGGALALAALALLSRRIG